MDTLQQIKMNNEVIKAQQWTDYILSLPLYIQVPVITLLFVFIAGKLKIKPFELFKPLLFFIEDLFTSERKKERIKRDTESRKRLEKIEILLISLQKDLTSHSDEVKELQLEVNNFFDTYSINNRFSSQLRKDLMDIMKDLSSIVHNHHKELAFVFKHQEDIKKDINHIKNMLVLKDGVVNANKE